MNTIDLMRIVARLFYIFPIKKNRVILTAYNGRQYGCSPKYISSGLLKQENKYEIYYALADNVKISLPNGINRVRYRSLKHFYILMTSKFIIFNSTGFSGMMPYRNNQVVINTWHGGGTFKKTGISSFSKPEDIRQRKISGDNTTYFISSSKAFGENQKQSMCLSEEKILNIGTPRNDVVFCDHEMIITKVHNYFGVSSSFGIILYAPTYRKGQQKAVNDYAFQPIDVQRILIAAKERFGKEFVFLYRAHHDIIPNNLAECCINATQYDDMQELLVASDILITDYSSAMWDYALMKKPGFLYTPDRKEYEDSNILGSSIDSWPYKAAETNEELATLIRDFDVSYNEKRINDYFEELGSYETGAATNKLIKIMNSLIN